MSKKTDQVKSGYASLDYNERLEIKAFITEFDNADSAKRIQINEDFNRSLNKSVGPRDIGVCSCCGR
jgi:hypothetical protein